MKDNLSRLFSLLSLFLSPRLHVEGGVSSTFRDSKQAPFHWAKDLSWNEVSFIQDSCKEALHLWGYKEASNASELLQNFNPLLPFPDFDFIAN